MRSIMMACKRQSFFVVTSPAERSSALALFLLKQCRSTMCTTVALVIFDALEFGKGESGQNYHIESTIANDGKHLQTVLKSFEIHSQFILHAVKTYNYSRGLSKLSLTERLTPKIGHALLQECPTGVYQMDQGETIQWWTMVDEVDLGTEPESLSHHRCRRRC